MLALLADLSCSLRSTVGVLRHLSARPLNLASIMSTDFSTALSPPPRPSACSARGLAPSLGQGRPSARGSMSTGRQPHFGFFACTGSMPWLPTTPSRLHLLESFLYACCNPVIHLASATIVHIGWGVDECRNYATNLVKHGLDAQKFPDDWLHRRLTLCQALFGITEVHGFYCACSFNLSCLRPQPLHPFPRA